MHLVKSPSEVTSTMEDQTQATQLVGEPTQVLGEQTQLLPGATLLQSTQLVGEPTQLVTGPEWQGDEETQPVDEEIVFSTAEGGDEETQAVEEEGGDGEGQEELVKVSGLKMEGLAHFTEDREGSPSVKEETAKFSASKAEAFKATSQDEEHQQSPADSTPKSQPVPENIHKAPVAEVIGGWRTTRKSTEGETSDKAPSISKPPASERRKSLSQPVDSDAPTEDESDGEPEVEGRNEGVERRGEEEGEGRGGKTEGAGREGEEQGVERGGEEADAGRGRVEDGAGNEGNAETEEREGLQEAAELGMRQEDAHGGSQQSAEGKGIQEAAASEQQEPEVSREQSPPFRLSAAEEPVAETRGVNAPRSQGVNMPPASSWRDSIIPDSDTEGPDGREGEFGTAPSVNAASQWWVLDSSQGPIGTARSVATNATRETDRGIGFGSNLSLGEDVPAATLVGETGDEGVRRAPDGAGPDGAGPSGGVVGLEGEPLQAGGAGPIAVQSGGEKSRKVRGGALVESQKSASESASKRGRSRATRAQKANRSEAGEGAAETEDATRHGGSDVRGEAPPQTGQLVATDGQMAEAVRASPEREEMEDRTGHELAPPLEPVLEDAVPVSVPQQQVSLVDEGIPELRPDQREPPFTQVDEDDAPVAIYTRRTSAITPARSAPLNFSAEIGEETQMEALGVVEGLLGLNDVDMSEEQDKGLEKKHSLGPEPKPSQGVAKSSSIAVLPPPQAVPRTLSIFDYDNSQVDAEPDEPVIHPKKAPAKATPAKRTRGGKTGTSRSMGPPKSAPNKASEEAGGGTGGWISRKGVGDEKKKETPATKESREKVKAGEKGTEVGRAKALSTGKIAQASGKGAVTIQAVPAVIQSMEGGRQKATAENKEAAQKNGEPVGGGLAQMNWTQAFAADSEPPENLPPLPPVVEETEKRKGVKRGLFAASLMSDEERAAEEKRAKEEEEKAEKDKAEKEKAEAEKQVPAKGRGRGKGKGKEAEPVAKEGAFGVATRVSPRRAGRGAAAKDPKKGRVSEEEQTAGPDAMLQTEREEEERGVGTMNEGRAVESVNGNAKGAKEAVTEPVPVGSSHRYKHTTKRRRSNEVTASERAATQKRLDRGFEDTEDADEEEEEESDDELEEDEEEGQKDAGGAGEANMLFMDSQVPILPKWKKLKGAKKGALKSALTSIGESDVNDAPKSAHKATRKEQSDTKRARPTEPSATGVPKSAPHEDKGAAGKGQLGAKRSAEGAGTGEAKRKKVEGGAKEATALLVAPMTREDPSAQAEGTGTGNVTEPAARGRRKRGKEAEKAADAVGGKAEERDAKRARGPGGRIVSSRFRETPSREAKSSEPEKPQTEAAKARDGGVQKAASVAPQEAPGARRRSSMVPIASLIRTRNRRGEVEQAEDEAGGLDLAFSQVPIASLREKKEVVEKRKPGAEKGPGKGKAGVGSGDKEVSSMVTAKGKGGSKRKAETLEEQSGLELQAVAERDEGGEGGVDAAEGDQDGEIVFVAAGTDAATEKAAEKDQGSGGRTTRQGAGKESAKEEVGQSRAVETRPARKGRKPKGEVEVAKTGRTDVSEGAEKELRAGSGNETGSGTVKDQGALEDVSGAEEEEEVVEIGAAAERKGKRSVGKRGRAAAKQGGAPQEDAKVEKVDDDVAGAVIGGEEQRPTKRTRRGQLVAEGAEKKASDEGGKAGPSERVSSRGAKKSTNEAEEQGTSKDEAPAEGNAERRKAEEAGGSARTLTRGARTSGDDGGGQGGRGRLSVRVSGRVSDDLEGLVSPTLRKKREMGELRVFVSSRMPDRVKAAQKKILKRLGAQEAQDVPSCTHLVAETFGRTQTMLEAIVGAKKIVKASWLESCGQANYFEDEEPHMLQDEKQEKKFNFSLKASLAAAKEKRIFEGLKVYITPNTTPDRNFFKGILEMGGGELITRFTGAGADSCLVVSSDKDRNLWEPLATKGTPIYTTEFLMSAVVQQQLDTSRNLLSGGGGAAHQTGAARVRGGGKTKPQRKGAAWR
ncbi:BRCT domain-containing DNA repair protein [Klebsormidium nitens]|uniref:BRCT domain-containing DNA repair protein n=1 Tax=Klebsormidium nitens TaxID=105231 RepID=A0A1Y1IB52_KLENI|nr:BRCT domain-containing DNA repair protein [Klebsormidium nitens]|eukprot:GAQ86351.1 BRCT domain-containing DNA repair protein [Klebsormidium nitens]